MAGDRSRRFFVVFPIELVGVEAVMWGDASPAGQAEHDQTAPAQYGIIA